MKPGIFYLYEYNHSRKLRNAGFLKVTRYYQSFTLTLNARGIPVSCSDTIKLCAFYLENDLANSAVLAELPCTNHAFSARLDSAESRFPDGYTLDGIDGFFLPLSNGHILAAATPGITVDPEKLLVLSSKSAEPVSEPAEDLSEKAPEDSALSPEAVPDDSASARTIPDHSSTDGNSSGQDHSADPHSDPISSDGILPDAVRTETTVDGMIEEKSEKGKDIPAERSVGLEAESLHECNTAEQARPKEQNAPPTQNTQTKQISTPEQEPSSNEHTAPGQTVKKIRRSEMSVLPRRYWHLANNSFLLHGYHNYHHLILVEKDGHYWLGVPGIYDPHEARAARLFGFPQFTDSYNDSLQLSEDECNPQENFGYWCCFLK